MNESLKRAQANYQGKCRIVNLRFNTETEKELIAWLEAKSKEGGIAPAIKALIKADIQK